MINLPSLLQRVLLRRVEYSFINCHTGTHVFLRYVCPRVLSIYIALTLYQDVGFNGERSQALNFLA
jgi:hypothetical protein